MFPRVCKTLAFGFQYGAAQIERMHFHELTGAVTLSVKTPRGDWQIYVTRTGMLRVFNHKHEELLVQKQMPEVAHDP